MHQDATWYGGSPQPRRLWVRWGPSPLSLKKDRAPQFLAHVYCGQTAAWIKMPLGKEVDLSLYNIVLDGIGKPVYNFLFAIIMVALCNRETIYIFMLWFVLLPSFFSSPNLSDRRLDVYHTLAYGVALVRI